MILCAASTPFALRVLLHALQGRHEDQDKVLLISDLSNSPEASHDFFRFTPDHGRPQARSWTCSDCKAFYSMRLAHRKSLSFM